MPAIVFQKPIFETISKIFSTDNFSKELNKFIVTNENVRSIKFIF